jgi:hypothetical protein
MIDHHNYYKVHLPKKEYKGDSDEELSEILMEEFYLLSDGKLTESYTSINPKDDKLEISLFPSILYAGNKLKYSEAEKFQFINNYLDHSFVDYLTRFNPLHKSISFIEYHLHFYVGDDEDFIKHIKYEILSIIRKRKDENKHTESDYKNLEIIVTDWVNSKMKKEDGYNTRINNAENVIINNGSKINNQKNVSQKFPKDKLAKYAFWITVIGLVISIIIGWKEITTFFN